MREKVMYASKKDIPRFMSMTRARPARKALAEAVLRSEWAETTKRCSIEL